jgi:hypothetical protein
LDEETGEIETTEFSLANVVDVDDNDIVRKITKILVLQHDCQKETDDSYFVELVDDLNLLSDRLLKALKLSDFDFFSRYAIPEVYFFSNGKNYLLLLIEKKLLNSTECQCLLKYIEVPKKVSGDKTTILKNLEHVVSTLCKGIIDFQIDKEENEKEQKFSAIKFLINRCYFFPTKMTTTTSSSSSDQIRKRKEEIFLIEMEWFLTRGLQFIIPAKILSKEIFEKERLVILQFAKQLLCSNCSTSPTSPTSPNDDDDGSFKEKIKIGNLLKEFIKTCKIVVNVRRKLEFC